MPEFIIRAEETDLFFLFKDYKELIRCKDCKFSSPNKVYGCRINSFADDLDKRMYSDDFCSRAERK